MPHGSVASTRSTAPSYSGKYFVEGVFKIPYFATAEPITAWTDTAAQKQKVEYYGGQDTYLYRYDIDKAFEIVPIINEFGCFATNVSGPATAKRAVLGDGPQVLPLVPDVSAWKYVGGAAVRGVATDAFQTTVTNVTTFGTGVSTYTMFVASDTRLPVRLQMEGINFIMGSHPDTYVFDYHQFRAVSHFDDGEFDVPEICASQNRATTELMQRRARHRLLGIHASLGRAVPPMHTYMRCEHATDDDFVAFTVRHAKRYASCDEHATRQTAYRANAAFVAAHNADASQTHTVELNHHADLTDEEYRALVLMPRNGAARRVAAASATHAHAGLMAADVRLPSSVNWDERGGVLPPKDQGACGSCWSFGSSESLSGAWFAKYGELIDLSEQQIVDCAWGYFSSMACDGGFAPGAFSYLMKAGGIGTELSYKYLAQDGWCNPNDHSSGVTVQGYVNVTGDAELMSALQVTPVAIAIDASLPSFRFYKHGIYQDPKCSRSLNELDHEVLAFGYGTDDASGLSYFLVRNSWSTMWGDNGDIKMKMGAGGCGVSAQATYPLV